MLSTFPLKQFGIGLIASVEIQRILPCGPDLFGGHGDELEDKRLDTAG